MHYVIVRDDDTNALTPVECLEKLYRPFLEKGLPVNLATIPHVRSDITYGRGIPEGFLMARNENTPRWNPIAENIQLVRFLLDNPGFHIVQHGYSHEFLGGRCEFEQWDRDEVIRRLEDGTKLLLEAGFRRPETFVAPYDRFTPSSMAETARRFRVISTSWFELKKIPVSWWPRYAQAKLRGRPHWKMGKAILLSHPGCHLSCHRPLATMLEQIVKSVRSRRLTVLVTHWWEYFRGWQPDEKFIAVLHETADYLARCSDIKVISFAELAKGRIRLD